MLGQPNPGPSPAPKISRARAAAAVLLLAAWAGLIASLGELAVLSACGATAPAGHGRPDPFEPPRLLDDPRLQRGPVRGIGLLLAALTMAADLGHRVALPILATFASAAVLLRVPAAHARGGAMDPGGRGGPPARRPSPGASPSASAAASPRASPSCWPSPRFSASADIAARPTPRPSPPRDPAPSANTPNVLLLVLDTVRHDHLSLYGYARHHPEPRAHGGRGRAVRPGPLHRAVDPALRTPAC